MKSLSILYYNIRSSKIFKDSFWAVFGSGLGSALMLLAGILIARFLGKDVYGEYGVVKTNMFYLAGFSTFGLGLTSTRFIAKYLSEDRTQIRGIIKTSSFITFVFSSLIALILIGFAKDLATYLDTPQMIKPFRYLSFIIIAKAMCTTGIGILAGLGHFKDIARNSVISGVAMILCCVPLTYYKGLDGSLISLSISQILNTALNYLSIQKQYQKYPIYYKAFDPKKLISFSFPVAMQEISYSICNWAGILALTKFSSMGEVGIYSATAQWNAIILFIPGLLHNVVLSHLSKKQTAESHKTKVNKILLAYLCCTTIPFVIVYFLAPFISKFYGPQFTQMVSVLQVLTFATIPLCCSDVYKSELLALGRPWLLFSIRCIKDIVFVGAIVLALNNVKTIGGALLYADINLIISICFFISLFIAYRVSIKRINS